MNGKEGKRRGREGGRDLPYSSDVGPSTKLNSENLVISPVPYVLELILVYIHGLANTVIHVRLSTCRDIELLQTISISLTQKRYGLEEDQCQPGVHIVP